MFKRFAMPLACVALILGSSAVKAEDRNTNTLMPMPDPVFSPELATRHQVKGQLMLEALSDIEISRQASRQTAAEARRESARLLAFDWNLRFDVDAKGMLEPGSSRFKPNPKGTSSDSTSDASSPRIPKGVVLLAIQIQQSQIDSIDSGNGGQHAGITGDELDLICGPDWIITWLEDENGNMIDGSAELYCGGQTFP
ncbi:MAG: hypothetical protein AAGG44_21365, partial [Planctomycetota bacterium]